MKTILKTILIFAQADYVEGNSLRQTISDFCIERLFNLEQDIFTESKANTYEEYVWLIKFK